MPIITYNATHFPQSYGPPLEGKNDLTVSWPQLVWAAISVGKGQLEDLAQYGIFSAFERMYRRAIVYANLTETPQGRLHRSSAYEHGLDPSEKGAISYFIGLTMAKLFTGQLLMVPWLMHLDVYWQQLEPILLGNSRPDLVGLTSAGEWVVVEAKGRTNGLSYGALETGKNQAQQLTTIHGVAPVLRIATLSYFNSGGLLRVAIDDPHGEHMKVPDLPLSAELILKTYYRPFEALIREAETASTELLGGEKFRVVPLPDLDLWVGLPEILPELPTSMPQRYHQQRENGNEFIGPDGLFVRLGSAWSDKNMLLEPQERRKS